ncbi:MAG: glutathione peroxidase [Woeseiaceae bacterium]
MKNLEGSNVPQVTFHTRHNHEWLDVKTDDIFKDKTVIVFSLPGAFTPTCSSTHVPRYNQLATTFKQHGVDDIICMSVNDAFVMNQWKKDQNANNVTFIPDGNGHFTDGMGMLVEKEDLGFGKRSWRYSMLVKNGIVEKMFIEEEVDGDPFDISDADTMLNYIAPTAKKPNDITIFTRPDCEYCVRAKAMLDESGMEYEELILNRDYTELTLRAVAGISSVPQIFIDGNYIGGSESLKDYFTEEKFA